MAFMGTYDDISAGLVANFAMANPAQEITTRVSITKRLLLQKRRCFPEKEIQLVVMQPVSRSGDGYQPAVAHRLYSRVRCWNRRKALLAPEQKRGRCDLAEDLACVLDIVSVRCNGPHVIIELDR